MKKGIKLFLVLMLCLLCAFVGTKSVMVQAIETNLEEVKVIGFGKFDATPNRAHVRLGFTVREDDFQKTYEKASYQYQRIVDGLGMVDPKLKEQVMVEYSNIYPVCDYQLNQYEYTINMEVTTDNLYQVDLIITKANELGATRCGDVWYTLEDNGEAQQEALKLATANAKEKASIIDDTLILSRIEEEDCYYCNRSNNANKITIEAKIEGVFVKNI